MNEGAQWKSFDSLFFSFLLDYSELSVSTPRKAWCSLTIAFQKWAFKGNHNEMGMLIEGFCWDPTSFSGSRSLLKPYKIPTDKNVNMTKIPIPGPRESRSFTSVPAQSQGKRLMSKNVFLSLITVSSK